MKELSVFIEEVGSVYAAAKKLGKPITTVHFWNKSEKRYFVVLLDGQLVVLAEK